MQSSFLGTSVCVCVNPQSVGRVAETHDMFEAPWPLRSRIFHFGARRHTTVPENTYKDGRDSS